MELHGHFAGRSFLADSARSGATVRVTYHATIKSSGIYCGDTINNVAFATYGGNTRKDNEVTVLDCPSTIEIVKKSSGGSQTFNFTTVPTPAISDFPAAYANFSLTPSTNMTSSIVMKPLSRPTGKTYVVTEADPGNAWNLSSIQCTVSPAGSSAAPTTSLANRNVSILLGQASKVTCTFTNEKPQVRIHLRPMR